MPFIKENLEDVKEGTVVPEGEYDLKVIKAEQGESKKGNDMITLTIKVDEKEYANARLIGHWLVSPEGADDQAAYLRKIEFKRFCVCFDLPFDCDAEDMVGATGRAYLNQEDGDDGEIYNRLKLPRIKDED